MPGPKITRRLFAGVAAATMLAASAADASFWKLHGLVGPPPVGPGPLFNGTRLSGGTPPSDPSRMGPKVKAHWAQPSEVRLWSDQVIGVDADAKGSIAFVDFWVEGNTQRVTQSVHVDTDVNGKTRKRLGFWITLKASLFKAVTMTGAAGIYAKVWPVDGSIQPRVIGYAATTGPGGATDNNRLMTAYPRATLYDFTADVGAGQTYSTLDAAIAAVKAGSSSDDGGVVQAAHIVLHDSANYELSTSSGSRHTGAKGFHVIEAATGVSATIRRQTAPDGTNAHFPIDPFIACLEFRGSGITIDNEHFSCLGSILDGRGARLNGVKVTRSAGLRDANWFNGGLPGIQPQFGPGCPGYVEDCDISFVPNVTINQLLVCRNRFNSVWGHLFTGTAYSCGNYAHSLDAGFFRQAINALQLTYTGAGTATVTRTGSGSDSGTGNGISTGGGFLNLLVNGSTVKQYNHGQASSDTWYALSAIAADITANVAGWAATALDTTRRASALTPIGSTSVTSTPVTLTTSFDQHCDVVIYTNTGAIENEIHRGDIIRGIGDTYSDNGTLTVTIQANLNDIIYSDCVFDGASGSAMQLGKGSGTQTCSNLYFRNCTQATVINLFSSFVGDSYTGFEQSVLGQIGWDTANGPTPLFVKDSYVPAGFQNSGLGTAFTVPPNSGNTILHTPASNTFTLGSLCVDHANGDYRPTVSMPTKSPLTAFDAFGNPRAATEAIGAVALVAAAPSWPF